MHLREHAIAGCFAEFVFQFSVVQVLVGLRKKFINNFAFTTWACAAGFNNDFIIIPKKTKQRFAWFLIYHEEKTLSVRREYVSAEFT